MRFLIKATLIFLLASFGASGAVYIKTPVQYTPTVGTTAKIIYPSDEGVITIFSNTGKVYYNLAGATPNALTSPYITAGQYLNTEQRYKKTNGIGVQSDSGTVTINVIIQDYNN
jgi:hypothetical protein